MTPIISNTNCREPCFQYASDEGELSQLLGDQTVGKAPVDGTVLYTTDGYEDLTEEDLTMDAFNQKAYKVTSLQQHSRVSEGDPVCRMITSEKWSLYIPLTDKQTVQLAPNKSMRVKFSEGWRNPGRGFLDSDDRRTAVRKNYVQQRYVPLFQ